MKKSAILIGSYALAAILLSGCYGNPEIMEFEAPLWSAGNSKHMGYVRCVKNDRTYGGTRCFLKGDNNKDSSASEVLNQFDGFQVLIDEAGIEPRLLNCEWNPQATGYAEDARCQGVSYIEPDEQTIYDKINQIKELRNQCLTYEADKWISENPGPGLTVYHEVAAMFVPKCNERHPMPTLPK